MEGGEGVSQWARMIIVQGELMSCLTVVDWDGFLSSSDSLAKERYMGAWVKDLVWNGSAA